MHSTDILFEPPPVNQLSRSRFRYSSHSLKVNSGAVPELNHDRFIPNPI